MARPCIESYISQEINGKIFSVLAVKTMYVVYYKAKPFTFKIADVLPGQNTYYLKTSFSRPNQAFAMRDSLNQRFSCQDFTVGTIESTATLTDKPMDVVKAQAIYKKGLVRRKERKHA